MTYRISATEARARFSHTIKRARRGQRCVIENRGRDLAALVSLDDLRLLEQIEDHYDIKAAQDAKERIKTEGTISWDELKRDVGL